MLNRGAQFISMRKIIFIPYCLSILIVLACSFLFSACYTLKQGTIMIGYLSRAVPLEKLVKKSDTEEMRDFVSRVESIRAFAQNELGLKPTKNYTTYVELPRDYLAAIVSASAQDSFTRYEWWFPIIGKVPYTGFFEVPDAQRQAKKLQK
jgi:predicted aminopeptidase